jgi:hypothetical protein
MNHTVTWLQTDGPEAGKIHTRAFTEEIDARRLREQITLYTNTYLVDDNGEIEGQPAEEWFKAVFTE